VLNKNGKLTKSAIFGSYFERLNDYIWWFNEVVKDWKTWNRFTWDVWATFCVISWKRALQQNKRVLLELAIL